MHCITLRTLAAQLLLSLPFAHADPTTTTTLTSTTIVRTEWIVITSASNTVTTFTTATFVAGSTIGITTVDGSQPLATPTPAATGSISMAWQGQSFQDAVLNSTNYYRAQHQASPLQWDDSLASYAQDYAKKCVFEHSSGPHGENLAENYATPAIAIDGWASEEKDYNYKKEKFSEAAGHYTQLVWKNTTSVGCGAVNCTNDGDNGANGWYLVCEYNPPGNVQGAFGSNVGKSGEGKDGEPGFGGVGRVSGAGRWFVVLVAMGVLAGAYA